MSFTDFFTDLFKEGGFGREVFEYLTEDEGGQMLTGLLGSYLANQSGFFGPNIPDVGYQGDIPDYQGMRQQVPVAMGQEYQDEQGQKYINPMGSGLGSIPQGYTLTNPNVPLMYDPNRRPGSGGRRYFTDMQYADQGAINQVAQQQQQQARGLLDLNLSNLAREQRSGSPVAPIPFQPYYPTPYGSDDDQDGGGQNGGGQNGDDQDDGGQDGGFFPDPDKGGDENGAQDTDDGKDEDTQGADDGGQDDGGQGADDGYFKYVPLSGDDDGYTTGDPKTIANNEARDDLAFKYLTPEYLEGLGQDGFITLNDRRAKGLKFATLDDAIDFVDKWNRIGLKEEGLDPYKASSAYGGVPISPTFNYSGTEPLTYYQIPTNRTESGDSFQRTFTSKEDAINHLANGYYDDDYFNQSAQSFIDRINDSRKFKSEKNKIPDAVDLDFNDAEGLEQMFKDMGRWSNETQRLIRTYNDEGRRKLIERQIQTVTLNKQDAEGGTPTGESPTKQAPLDQQSPTKQAPLDQQSPIKQAPLGRDQRMNALFSRYTSDDYMAGVDPNDYISFNKGPAYLRNLKFATLEDARKFLQDYNMTERDTRTSKYAGGGLASLSDNYRNRRRMFMPGPYASEPGRGRPNPYNNPISSSPGFPDDPISSSPGFPTPTRPDPRPNPYYNPIATSPGFPDDQIIGQEDTTTYELPYNDPRDEFANVGIGVDDFGDGIIGQEDTTTYELPSDDPRNEFATVGIGVDDFGETPRDRFKNSDIGRRLRERVEKIRAGRGRNRPTRMRGFEEGGIARAAKGRYLNGSTDGMADKVPATIDGRQPAALSDGEFVIPADVVSHLGNGNSEAGAKVLQQMMARIRKERTGNSKQGKEIRPKKMLPA